MSSASVTSSQDQGKRDDLKARLDEGLAELRVSEGCFGAQIFTVREKPDEFAVVSRWASGAALDRYLQQRTGQRRRVV